MSIKIVLAVLGLAVTALAAPPVHAEQHVFIIASNADGYGVDRCLATGATCGTTIATAYCQAHDYSDARWFHKFGRDEITASIAAGPEIPAGPEVCQGGRCDDMVAIACTR